MTALGCRVRRGPSLSTFHEMLLLIDQMVLGKFWFRKVCRPGREVPWSLLVRPLLLFSC